MGVKVTVELPQGLADRARAVAARTQRPVEEVLVEWIDRAAEPPVETLSDAELLALCDSQLDVGEQDELSDLLARNRDRELSEVQRARLDELMRGYRRGLVRKALALKVAVGRGLRPTLN